MNLIDTFGDKPKPLALGTQSRREGPKDKRRLSVNAEYYECVDKDRGLRRFGLSLGLGLMVLSTILKLRGRHYLYLVPVSILIVLTALTIPGLLKSVKNILERLINIITNLLTAVLLILLFYLVVTPLGIIAKIFRHKFLKLKFEDIPSYFEKRPVSLNKEDKECYERQF
jgi:uncharacterized membrane protein YccC